MTDLTITTTRIVGASDDLIEMYGAIDDEFGAYDVNTMLTFDNGVRLTIDYTDDGVWRIKDCSLRPGLVTITACEDRPGYEGPDGPVYSDEAVVEGASKVSLEVIPR